jgi:hypothetical protein
MTAPVLGSAPVAMTKDATTPRLKARRLHTGGSAADFLTMLSPRVLTDRVDDLTQRTVTRC